LVQVLGLPHCPAEVYVCTALPEHWSEPGVHAPEHAPETQAELAQAEGEPQFPIASQVCTPLPEHCVAPGVQTPAHAPLWHT
jgi:hypothetical protein